MRRNALKVALGVAVVSMLVAPLAFGSNMGFKLERNLDLVPGGRSIYFVSFPFYRSFADNWDTATGTLQPGGSGSDGIWSDDVLVDWFTNGDGSCDGAFPSECNGQVSLQFFETDPGSPKFNQFDGQTILYDPFSASVQITGAAFDIENLADPGKGYQAQVFDGNFPTVTVGSHNPDVTTFTVTYQAGSRNLFPHSLPYHTTFVTSEDLLSAIPDGDWEEGVSLQWFVNTIGDPKFNQMDGQTVFFDPFAGGKAFTGSPHTLVPGEGYVIQLPAPPTPDPQVDIPLPHY